MCDMRDGVSNERGSTALFGLILVSDECGVIQLRIEVTDSNGGN